MDLRSARAAGGGVAKIQRILAVSIAPVEMLKRRHPVGMAPLFLGQQRCAVVVR